MNVLLVEDDENKSREIASFVEARHMQVSVVRSLHGGRKALKSQQFDLVILDMTLPNYDVSVDEPGGGSVHSFGGEKLLRYMNRLELDTPAVVVTQFELFVGDEGSMDIGNLDLGLRRVFGQRYLGTVYYHASLSRWRLDLGQLLDGVAESVDVGRHL